VVDFYETFLNHVNCGQNWANIKHTLYEDLYTKNKIFRRICENGRIYVFCLEISV